MRFFLTISQFPRINLPSGSFRKRQAVSIGLQILLFTQEELVRLHELQIPFRIRIS